MNDLKQKAIDAVIHALGTSKAFSDGSKKIFAENIINEVLISYSFGLELGRQKKYYRELRHLLKNAKTAMTRLYEKIASALDGGYIDAQAIIEIRKHTGQEVNSFIFVEYIETVERIVDSQQLAKRKPGPNNQAPLLVARMIAAQYYKQFGKFPAFAWQELRYVGKRGSGEDILKQTPYERVCSTIEKLLHIKIPQSTQQNAIKFVQKEFVNQKKS